MTTATTLTTAAAPNTGVTHLPVLDGLRAIAVLMVLWSHLTSVQGYPLWLGLTAEVIRPGGLGVDIFFVLSGFLITRILLAERRENVPVRWFLLRRAVRIFPIYYLLLALFWISELVNRAQVDVPVSAELPWCAIYLGNFYFALHPADSGPLGHTWSLCVEEHFYLLWPLCIAWLTPAAARRVVTRLVLPAAVALAVLAGCLCERETALALVKNASPTRFLSLGIGCWLAFAEPALFANPRRWSWLALLLLLVGTAASDRTLYVVVPHLLGWPVGASLLPASLQPAVILVSTAMTATGCVLGAIVASRWSPWSLLRLLPLRWLGRISYGVYLYHLPLFFLLFDPQRTPFSLGVAVAATLLLASVSYLGIERPLLRWAARFRGARA